jgi:hypothetical protein
MHAPRAVAHVRRVADSFLFFKNHLEIYSVFFLQNKKRIKNK